MPDDHPLVRYHPSTDDDLLKGFRHPGERPGELRGFFATTIAISIVAWEMAFDLGAYHTVFYYRLLQIFVVSAVLLLGALVLRRHLTVHPWMLTVLSIPVVWLIWRLIAPVGGWWHHVYHAIDGILVGLVVLTLPITLWAVARIVAPEYFGLSTQRLRLASALIILVIAVAGFLTGQFNNHVVTCEAFVLAGDDVPSNCRHGPDPLR